MIRPLTERQRIKHLKGRSKPWLKRKQWKKPGHEEEAKKAEPSDFSTLLKKEFNPKSDRAQEAVENAVRTLAEYVLKDVSFVSPDAVRTIEAIKADDRPKVERTDQPDPPQPGLSKIGNRLARIAPSGQQHRNR